MDNDYFSEMGLLYYDDLSDNVKSLAKNHVFLIEKRAYKLELEKARKNYRENSHRSINDPYHIARVINGSKALNLIRQHGDLYLLKFIRSNLCMFNKDGDYFSFFDQVFYNNKNINEYPKIKD